MPVQRCTLQGRDRCLLGTSRASHATAMSWNLFSPEVLPLILFSFTENKLSFSCSLISSSAPPNRLLRLPLYMRIFVNQRTVTVQISFQFRLTGKTKESCKRRRKICGCHKKRRICCLCLHTLNSNTFQGICTG